jgi:hypothetical protein
MSVKLSNGAEMSIIWGTHAMVDIGDDGRATNCELRCWDKDDKVFHDEDMSGMDGNMARMAIGDIIYIANELMSDASRCCFCGKVTEKLVDSQCQDCTQLDEYVGSVQEEQDARARIEGAARSPFDARSREAAKG